MKIDFHKLNRADFEVISRQMSKEEEAEISARLQIIKQAKKTKLGTSNTVTISIAEKR